LLCKCQRSSPVGGGGRAETPLFKGGGKAGESWQDREVEQRRDGTFFHFKFDKRGSVQKVSSGDDGLHIASYSSAAAIEGGGKLKIREEREKTNGREEKKRESFFQGAGRGGENNGNAEA